MGSRLIPIAPALVIIALFCPVQARGDSVIHNKSSNYVRLHADSTGSFVGATVSDTSSSTPADATAAPLYDEPQPPYQNSISAPISMTPASGLPKDHINGIFDVTYLFGNMSDGGATQDSLQFNIESDISTGDARNSVGEPSSAKLRSNGSASFFIDTGFFRPPGTALAPGAIAGQLNIPALGPLDTAYESLVLTVQEDGTPIGTFGPSSSGATFDLRAGHGYRVDVTYAVNIPYGIDPHGDYQITIGVVPEPAALTLLFPALLLLRRLRCAR